MLVILCVGIITRKDYLRTNLMSHYVRHVLLVLLCFLSSSCSNPNPVVVTAATQSKPPQATDTVIASTTPTEQEISLFPIMRIGNGALEQMKWTKDGKSIIFGTTAGIFIYDSESLVLINEFAIGQSVYYLAVHPLGRVISAGAEKSNYENITLWDIQTGKPVTTLHGDCGCVFTNVAFSPDGSLLAAGNNKGQVWVWEWASGKVFRTLEFDNPSDDLFVRYVEFNPDGLSLAAGSDNNGQVELFNLISGDRLLALDRTFWFLSDLTFNHNGKRVALAGNVLNEGGSFPQYRVKVYDSTTGTLLYEINQEGESADFVVFDTDDNSLITGSCKSYGTNSEVCLKARVAEWNARDGTFKRFIKEYTSSLLAGDYSPDGKQFGIITWDKVPLFEIWDVTTGQIIKSIEWYVGPSSSIVFSPDNKTAIWGDTNQTIRFLDINTKSLISMWYSDDGEVVNLAMSDDGSVLASSARYGDITLWDVHTGDILGRIQTRNGFQIYSIRFSPNNRWLAWTEEDLYRMDESQIQVYDVEQRRTKFTVTGLSFSVTISPDSSTLAIVDADDKTVRLFEIETGSLLRTFIAPDYIDQVVFNPAGTVLVASCFNTNILFWDIASGKLLHSFDAYSPSDIGSIHFALFPESKFLIFSSGPNIKILNLENYQLALEKSHFIGGTRDLSVSLDEKTIATSSSGEAAWLWQVDGIFGQ